MGPPPPHLVKRTKEDVTGLYLTKAIKRNYPAAARATAPTLPAPARTHAVDVRLQGTASIALTEPAKHAEPTA
jgi:hypothetical protein